MFTGATLKFLSAIVVSSLFSVVATGATAANPRWSFTADHDHVYAEARSLNLRVLIRLTCNKSGVAFTFEGYKGHALKRIDDLEEGVVLQLEGHQAWSSNVRVHYFEPDMTWVETGDLPTDFLSVRPRTY